MIRYIINLLHAVAGKVCTKREFEERVHQIDHESSLRYQTLIENLRSRIAEREQTLKETHIELSARIRALHNRLEAVLDENERLKSEIGTLMKYRTLFEKTKHSIDTLCAAMAESDTEKMREIVEQLEWSDSLTRIAHYHISVLDGIKTIA